VFEATQLFTSRYGVIPKNNLVFIGNAVDTSEHKTWILRRATISSWRCWSPASAVYLWGSQLKQHR